MRGVVIAATLVAAAVDSVVVIVVVEWTGIVAVVVLVVASLFVLVAGRAVRKDADTPLAATARDALVRLAASSFGAECAVREDGDTPFAAAVLDTLVRAWATLMGKRRASHAVHHLRALGEHALSLRSRRCCRRIHCRQRERPAVCAVGASKVGTRATARGGVGGATRRGQLCREWGTRTVVKQPRKRVQQSQERRRASGKPSDVALPQPCSVPSSAAPHHDNPCRGHAVMSTMPATMRAHPAKSPASGLKPSRAAPQASDMITNQPP